MMTLHTASALLAQAASRPSPRPRRPGAGALNALVQPLALGRLRRRLAGLDARRVSDMDLTREEAFREAGPSF